MQEMWVWLGRSLEEEIGNGNLLHSCLENPMHRGAWWVIVHGITKSQIWLSVWTTINNNNWEMYVLQDVFQHDKAWNKNKAINS